MPSDRTRVVLLVQGFEENPMAIGRILGLQSSESWFKGDLVYERASVRHKSNGWLLESGVSKFEVCRVHLAALLETVEGSIDNFRGSSHKCVHDPVKSGQGDAFCRSTSVGFPYAVSLDSSMFPRPRRNLPRQSCGDPGSVCHASYSSSNRNEPGILHVADFTALFP